MSRGLVRLLALTCGVTVANIYYAQPLLHMLSSPAAQRFLPAWLRTPPDDGGGTK